jgi:asparagine synthase (glutamine-hydrolysing)
LENSHDLKQSVIEYSRFTPRSDFELFFPNSHHFIERDNIYHGTMDKPLSFLERLLYIDRKTYLLALLNRLDKTSMAASLEARVAFLDHRLVLWSTLLPEKTKIKLARANKVIVKKVAEQWLPKEIVYRKKVGFGVPLSTWFRNSRGLGQYLDVLTDKTFKERGYFNVTSTERLIKEHLSGEKDHNEILWGLLNLELWCRMFIDNNAFHQKPTAS